MTKQPKKKNIQRTAQKMHISAETHMFAHKGIP